MITVEKKMIRNRPTLWVEDALIHNNQAPLLVFWHGWTSVKERNLHYAYIAAEQGYRVLLPEATGHGERLDELSETERKLGFWKVVLQSLSETGQLFEEVRSAGLIGTEKIIIGGTSMGAVIALGALKAFSFIDSGISLMGHPYYVDFAESQLEAIKRAGIPLPYSEQEIDELLSILDQYDLGNHPEALNGRPVFFWHGKKDNEVPFVGTESFYHANKHHYPGESDLFTYSSDPDAGHSVTISATQEMLSWLKKLQTVPNS